MLGLALDDHNSFPFAYDGHCICAGAVDANAKCESSWSMQALHLLTAGCLHRIADVGVGIAVHRVSQLTYCWHAQVSQYILDEARGP